MPFSIEAACGNSIGKIRKNNEDNFYFHGKSLECENQGLKKPVAVTVGLERGCACFSIFDGMGGEAHGEVASYTAARTMQAAVERLENYIIPEKQFLVSTCEEMNAAVYQAAQKLDAAQMGTTAVALLFGNHEVYACNIGDSRAFRLRQGAFLQLSSDHTDAEYLKTHGITSRKPYLTQYLGMNPEELRVEPYIAKGELQAADQYLLCSDGLTDMLPNFEIARIMAESQSAEECVQALIGRALEEGGRDNVTVIVLRINR